MNHRALRCFGLAIVTAAGVLAGCTSAPSDGTHETAPAATAGTTAPTSSAPPAPSASSTLSREDEAFTEALASLTEYVALAGEVENAGGHGWEELRAWWGTPEMRDSGASYYQAMVAQNLKTIGYGIVRDANPTNITLDPTDMRSDVVAFDYCLDLKDAELYEADGTLSPSSGKSVKVSLVMRREYPTGHWTIDSQTVFRDPPC